MKSHEDRVDITIRSVNVRLKSTKSGNPLKVRNWRIFMLGLLIFSTKFCSLSDIAKKERADKLFIKDMEHRKTKILKERDL